MIYMRPKKTGEIAFFQTPPKAPDLNQICVWPAVTNRYERTLQRRQMLECCAQIHRASASFRLQFIHHQWDLIVVKQEFSQNFYHFSHVFRKFATMEARLVYGPTTERSSRDSFIQGQQQGRIIPPHLCSGKARWSLGTLSRLPPSLPPSLQTP